jgi:hypothetical protein
MATEAVREGARVRRDLSRERENAVRVGIRWLQGDGRVFRVTSSTWLTID